MSNERCLQICEYFSEILDKTASYETEDMFYDHLAGCEKCRARFEVAKSLHDALRDDSKKTDSSFSDEVMERIKIESEKTNHYGSFFMRYKALIIVFIVVIICVVAGGVTLAVMKSKPVQNIETEQKPVTTNSDAEFINGFAEKLTGSASSASSSWTSDRFLSLAGSPVADEKYSYIAFLQVKSDTLFGMDDAIEYVKGSRRGGVSFYKTTLLSGEVVAFLGKVLVKDCLLSGSGTSGLLVVVCE